MIVRDETGLDRDAGLPAPRIQYPCSQSQVRFWIEEQLAPQNPALNVAVRWRLEGTLAPAVLEAAWRRLIERHEPLRTWFSIVDDQPVQIVERAVPFWVISVDLRAVAPADATREVDRLAEIEARTPFDIAAAPLVRVTRLIIDERTSILLVTAHHAVCDGWSIGILAREMGQICAALGANVAPLLPDLALSFGEFARWEREGAASNTLEGERDYVRALLRDHHQFELLPDHPRPRRLTSNGAIATRLLDRTLTGELVRLGRNNGCTLFMTALAALFVLLHRYTGETDIVLGTQVVGRDDEDLEKLVGCFINTIALRGDLSGDPDFATLLDRTRDMVSDTFDVRALPLAQLVEIARPVRDASRNALFSLNFIFQRSFIANDTYGSFDLIDMPSRSAGALYDLNVFMVERPDGWRVSCEYNTDLFDPQTVTGLLERFENVLRSIAADAATPISQISVLSAADRQALIVNANQTHAPYPADTTVTQLVARQVVRTPDAIAVVSADRSLTYAQLGQGARRLAGELARRGCAPGSRVGILLDRSIDMVVALLAVLEAGCAYVPLDPKFPAQRIAFIAQDAALAAIVSRSKIAGATGLNPNTWILIDDLRAQSGAASVPSAAVPTSSDDVAYVIYTSGSTGQPKGVQITHNALVNFLFAMQERPGIGAGDTLVAVTTISFDIAGLELLLPLVTGAKLVIAGEDDVVDGAALDELLRRSHATIVQATPVTWQLLIDAGWTGDPAMRMLCGGEALSRPLAESMLDRGPEVWNMYGPTETTIWSAATRVTRGDGPVLIGPPIANTQFYILDANRELMPPGAPGELYIGGDGVALGYFGRADLTRERFVPDVFGGAPGARLYRTGDLVRTRAGGHIEFLGRSDHQVKIRGFRVELDEIAAVLVRQPGVADAVAVVIASDTAHNETIAAYIVGQPPSDTTSVDWPTHVRAQIGAYLPAYMVPATIVRLDRLPRTPNGKIDRRALPALAAQPTGNITLAEPPATAREQTIASIAGELLGREDIGRNDDLFALGFHSLLVVRLVARLARAFDVRLALRAVFDLPTIAGIAGAIETLAAHVVPPPPVADRSIAIYNERAGGTPLIFLHSDAEAEGLYCGRLAAAIGPWQRLIALAPHGSLGLRQMPTIAAMARDHITRLKVVAPSGPYRVGGHCVGGIVAFEIARQLRAQGDVVEQLFLVNAYAPLRTALPGVDWLQRFVGLNAALDWRLREKICLNVARVSECIDRGPAALLRFIRARLATAAQLRERERANALAFPLPVERESGSRETEAYFAYTVAGFIYHPPVYTGKTTLFLSRDEHISMGDPNRGDPTNGWNRLAPGVRIISIDGGHNSPIQERVEELGALIADAIQT